jgi:hypothetical protein
VYEIDSTDAIPLLTIEYMLLILPTPHGDRQESKRGREKDRKREREKERKREKGRKREDVCVYVCVREREYGPEALEMDLSLATSSTYCMRFS